MREIVDVTPNYETLEEYRDLGACGHEEIHEVFGEFLQQKSCLVDCDQTMEFFIQLESNGLPLAETDSKHF